MSVYEHVFIARPDITAQQVETLIKDFTDIVTDGGGKVTKTEYWGLRNTAYKIKKNRKAHYVMLHLDSAHPAVAEMERQQRLHEDVLRAMTIRVDELEEGPSAVMRHKADKRDRDDRPNRGGDRPDRSDRSDRPDRTPRES